MDSRGFDTSALRITFPANGVLDDAFVCKMTAIFEEHGVVVVEGVFSQREAEEVSNDIIKDFLKLCPDVSMDDVRTWTPENIPPCPRFGLFQSLVCNLRGLDRIRSDERVVALFTRLYGALRGRTYVGRMLCSNDGMTLRPAHRLNRKGAAHDWAHFDLTQDMVDKRYGPLATCIQGQAVLRDSTAGFRCTPGSHKHFYDASAHEGKGGWDKLDDARAAALKARFGEGRFQVKVLAPAGSVILWSSATLHSAQEQDEASDGSAYKDLRHVAYVCWRPADDTGLPGSASLRRLVKRLDDAPGMNRGTNHWGTRLFALNTRFSGPVDEKRAAGLMDLIKHPEKAYDVLGYRPRTGALWSGLDPARRNAVAPEEGLGSCKRKADHQCDGDRVAIRAKPLVC